MAHSALDQVDLGRLPLGVVYCEKEVEWDLGRWLEWVVGSRSSDRLATQSSSTEVLDPDERGVAVREACSNFIPGVREHVVTVSI
jgi:hypothetical protein